MKKRTLTIALCVYNEELNIQHLIQSLLIQKRLNFKLERILIILDGCTDKTLDIVNDIKSDLIKVINHKNKIGKSIRLNEIYRKTNSEVLIQTDADVIFGNKYVVSNIVKLLYSGNDIGMCTGNAIPIKGRTFIERAINYTWEANATLRDSLPPINNLSTVDGKILGFKKELYKKFSIPNIIGNDRFAYYSCLMNGFNCQYAKYAIVYYKSPSNLSEHLIQNTRFYAIPYVMRKFFTKELIDVEINTSVRFLTKPKIIQFIKHPFSCIVIFFINRLCLYNAKKKYDSFKGTWKSAISSKLILQSNLIN